MDSRPSSTLTWLRNARGKTERPKNHGTWARYRSFTTSARRARGKSAARTAETSRPSKWWRKSEAATTSNERGEGQAAHVRDHTPDTRRGLADMKQLDVHPHGQDRPRRAGNHLGGEVRGAAAHVEQAAAGGQVGTGMARSRLRLPPSQRLTRARFTEAPEGLFDRHADVQALGFGGTMAKVDHQQNSRRASSAPKPGPNAPSTPFSPGRAVRAARPRRGRRAP